MLQYELILLRQIGCSSTDEIEQNTHRFRSEIFGSIRSDLAQHKLDVRKEYRYYAIVKGEPGPDGRLKDVSLVEVGKL